MKLPRVKEMLVPYVNETGDAIRVGGHQMNIAREIEIDNPEKFLSLLKTINGTNTIEQIANINNLQFKETQEIIEGLKEYGILYENSPYDFDFSEQEIEYYNRNINFFAWIDVDGLYYNYWEVQYKLKKSNVLLLGAGGTGGQCAKNLARLGLGNITIVDYDKVELSNLNRQEFRMSDIGKLKTVVLKEQLFDINPFINISIKDIKIEETNDLLEINDDFDIIIACIDKPRNINEIIEEYSDEKDIPWILGGYASTIMNHAIFKKDSLKYTNIINSDKENSYDASKLFSNDFWKWENAIISPIASISGSISSLYCLYYLTNLKEMTSSCIQHLDFYNIQTYNDFSYMLGELPC